MYLDFALFFLEEKHKISIIDVFSFKNLSLIFFNELNYISFRFVYDGERKMYHLDVGLNYRWCHGCVNKSSEDMFIRFDHREAYKKDCED